MPVYVFVPLLVVALLAGFGVAYLLLRNRQGNGASAIEAKATQTLSEAETQAKEKLLEAKEEAVKVRTAAEQEAREYRVQSQQIEKRLLQKEENLDRKGEDLNRRESELRARETVTESIQPIAANQTAEVSVSVLPLPTDELKGRIIGKEGRNIRALQQATGIDLIVDDTPEAVIISGFDPVRREVARVALNKLIVDGRIHPARIEEIVAKSRQE